MATSRTTKQCYIGQTTTTLEIRKAKHKNKSKTMDYKFYRAIREYGWDDFEWKTLIEVDKPEKEIEAHLDNLEERFIGLYDTLNSGYNSTSGGSNCTKMSKAAAPVSKKTPGINEQIAKIVSKEELEDLAQIYKLRLLKNPNKSINLIKLCESRGIGRRKYDKVIALLGGADHLHKYLSQTITLVEDNIQNLLNEAIKTQHESLSSMSTRDRNDLIKTLISVSAPANPVVNVNIDSFMRDQEIVDVTTIVD